MCSEPAELQTLLRKLQGQLRGYNKMEVLLKNKSDLLTVALTENQFLKTKLNRFETQSTVSTNCPVVSQTSLKPQTMETIYKSEEATLPTVQCGVKKNSGLQVGSRYIPSDTVGLCDERGISIAAVPTTQQSNTFNSSSKESCSVDDKTAKSSTLNSANFCRSYFDSATSPKCLSPLTEGSSLFTHYQVKTNNKVADCRVVPAQPLHCAYTPKISINTNVKVRDSVKDIFPNETNELCEIKDNDLPDEIDRESTLLTQADLQSINHILIADSYHPTKKKVHKTNSLPDNTNTSSIDTQKTDKLSSGYKHESVCETTGVHLVARDIHQNSKVTNDTHKPPMLANYQNHIKTFSTTPYNPPKTTKSSLPGVHDKSCQPSYEGDNDVVKLLRSQENLQCELALRKEYIIAMEKENKFFRRKLNQLNQVNENTAASISDSVNNDVNAELLRNYETSTTTINQLQLEVETLTKSLEQAHLNEQYSLSMKDKMVRELKKKYSNEKSRNSKLNAELARQGKDSVCRRCHALRTTKHGEDQPLISGNCRSVVVHDLLSEITAQQHQMACLTEDYHAEHNDKTELKLTCTKIQQNMSDLRHQVIQLEAELESSTKDLQETLAMYHNLQEKYSSLAGVQLSKANRIDDESFYTKRTFQPFKRISGTQLKKPQNSWQCTACTYENNPKRTACDVCGLLRYPPPRPSKPRHSNPVMVVSDTQLPYTNECANDVSTNLRHDKVEHSETTTVVTVPPIIPACDYPNSSAATDSASPSVGPNRPYKLVPRCTTNTSYDILGTGCDSRLL